MVKVLKNNDWVAKFGGTSVATYEAIERCTTIIANHPNIKIVVVSAPAGITNLLLEISQCHQHKEKTLSIFNAIKNKINHLLAQFSDEILHQEIKNMLLLVNRLVIQLSSDHEDELIDELLAFGERLSARLFSHLLTTNGFPTHYLDARTLIKTSNHFGKAEVLMDETQKNVNDLLLPLCANQIIVTEGFIASTLQNKTTTLGRGGSDYTAALLAEAINAGVLQIWTDVPGIYTADPKLIPHAKMIDNISFQEAAELATFGAKILHPATLWPAIRKNIPVFVGSSLKHDGQGTWIKSISLENENSPLFRAITLRRNQSLLTITSLRMHHAHGFLAKVFSILANHQLSVDLVTTSEVSIALTLNQTNNSARELLSDEILFELEAIGNVTLKVDKNLCLIALIGNHLHLTQGVCGRLFHLLRAFNIRLISQGASPHNLCFLVNDSDAEDVVKTIHKEFFEKDEV